MGVGDVLEEVPAESGGGLRLDGAAESGGGLRLDGAAESGGGLRLDGAAESGGGLRLDGGKPRVCRYVGFDDAVWFVFEPRGKKAAEEAAAVPEDVPVNPQAGMPAPLGPG